MTHWRNSWLSGLIYLLLVPAIPAQGTFMVNNKKGFFKQRFDLVSNLVIVPVEVNGTTLSFLLDTGFNATIIFSLEAGDSLQVENTTDIYLRGLGGGKPIRGIKSTGNTVILGEAVNHNETIYVVEELVMGLSNRLGVPVNGILGYTFFRDLVVRFNYPRKFMKVYQEGGSRYPKCRGCQEIPLQLVGNKAYLRLGISLDGRKNKVNLLLDSGSGDGLWLFAGEGLDHPKESFPDFLGFGLTGSVYGSRSRLDFLDFGKYRLEAVTASFPDSIFIRDVGQYDSRQGSVGALVLSRFHWVLDYPGKRFLLRPNSRFREPFEYDMSGLVLEHHGYRIIRDPVGRSQQALSVGGIPNQEQDLLRQVYQVRFSLEPQFRIGELRPGSPAELAGLRKGDILMDINGRPAYGFTLERIMRLLTSREGKRIRLIIQRGLAEHRYSFRLKRVL